MGAADIEIPDLTDAKADIPGGPAKASGAAGIEIPEVNPEDAGIPVNDSPSGAAGIEIPDASPDNGVPGSNEYQDTLGRESALGQALQYPANIMFTGTKDAAVEQGKGGGLLSQLEAFYSGAKDAAHKKRRTEIKDVMKAMADLQSQGKTLLPAYNNLGEADGNFQLGDIPDAIRDFTVGGALDPLSYAAGPVLRPVGGLISKGAKGVSKLTPELSLLQRGLQKVTPGVGAGMAAGGLIGGSMTPKDGDNLDVLSNVAKGAVLFGAGGIAAKPVGEVIKKAGDAAFDAGAVWLKGQEFAGVSKMSDLMKTGREKITRALVDINQNYVQKFTGIKPDAKLAGAKINERLTSEFITRRESTLLAMGEKKASGIQAELDELKAALGDRRLTKETPLGEAKEIQALKKQILHKDAELSKTLEEQGYKLSPLERNSLDESIANDMHADGTVAAALEGHAKESVDAYNATMKFNEEMLSNVNKEIYGQVDGKWNRETGEGIAGIPFHIEDLKIKQNMQELDGIFRAGDHAGPLKMARSPERLGLARKEIGPDESKRIYMRSMAYNFADKQEREAMKFMADYHAAPAREGFPALADKTLKLFDSASSFMKFNMLGPSASWIKNNYPDNVTKAYHQVGLLGALDAATLGRFRVGLWGDVKKLSSGDFSKPLRHKYSQAMAREGILETNIGHEVDAKDPVAKYFMTPDALEKAAADKPGLGRKILMSPYNLTLGGLGKVVMRVGGHIESTAKATTFIRAMEHIKADKALFKHLGQEGAEKLAGKIVKETFFDYNDVTEFERAVGKRLIPFYTFFSKNAKYYATHMSNPDMLGRMAAGNRARELYGPGPSTRPLTEKESEGTPDYIRRGDPRHAGPGPTGGTKFMFSPSNSMNDAAALLSPGMSNLIVEKMHPFIKTPIELIQDVDTFTKRPMYPSSLGRQVTDKETKTKYWTGFEKPLFSGGRSHVALKDGIEKITEPGLLRDMIETALGVSGVKLNKRGDPVSTEDSQVIIDRLSPLGLNSVLMPKPIVKQVAGAYGKEDQGKLTIDDLINNIWNTHQITNLSKKAMDWERGRNEENKVHESRKAFRRKQEANKP